MPIRSTKAGNSDARFKERQQRKACKSPCDYETRCAHERVACHVCGEPEPLQHYAAFLRNKLDELTRNA